jgi:hypothetical protein
MKIAHFKEACIPSPSTPPTFHTSFHIILQPNSSLTSSLHPTFFSQFLYHLHISFSITPTVLRIAVFFLCHLWLSQPPILSFLAYAKHPFCHLTSAFLHVSPLSPPTAPTGLLLQLLSTLLYAASSPWPSLIMEAESSSKTLAPVIPIYKTSYQTRSESMTLSDLHT